MGKRISASTFVYNYMKVCTAGGGYKELAAKLHLSKKQAYAKAAFLRRAGVKLPKMRHQSGNKLNVSEINALIKNFE